MSIEGARHSCKQVKEAAQKMAKTFAKLGNKRIPKRFKKQQRGE